VVKLASFEQESVEGLTVRQAAMHRWSQFSSALKRSLVVNYLLS